MLKLLGMELPDHPDKFSTDWLAQMLGYEGLSQFDYAPVGTGQVGDSYRLSLTWDAPADKPATIIAKCPAANPQSRETGKNLHNYEMEVNWYLNFARDAAIRTPHCYYTAIADDVSSFVLLMEDVAPAQPGDQLAGASLEQVKLGLDEIALLHAFKWQDETLRDIFWLNFNDQNQALLQDIVPHLYEGWSARYRDRLAPEILDVAQRLLAVYQNYIAPRERPLCVAHGDLRLDNILYSDKDGRAIIVDWQTVNAGAPMSDVAYFIGTSFADPAMRAAAEEELVLGYLQKLSAQGIVYDHDAAWKDYRLSAFSGLLMAIIASMFVERTARGDEMFAIMAERSGAQALHLNSLDLL